MSILYMLVGLPASAKSTWAESKQNELDFTIHSSDKLREELYGDVNDTKHNEDLFVELHKRVKSDLNANKNVCYDATSLSSKRRISFLKELKHINCRKVCVLFCTPYELCLKRNSERERVVPEYVMQKMYKNFQIPFMEEGWDEIRLVYDLDDIAKYQFNFNTTRISQDNPHHTLSLYNHLLKTMKNVENETGQSRPDLLTAAWYHDTGKVFTKDFHNSHGEPTETAHYYNHHNVSTYIALIDLILLGRSYSEQEMAEYVEHVLYICKIINDHMKPYLQWKDSEKAKNKDVAMLGEQYYKDILILNNADRNAK